MAANSKLNNFTRIEPVLHLLGIPFDTNVARDIMTERHSVATRVMYQLYIALNNKKKSNLTGVAMETMRPAAPARLNIVETEIYKQRLKQATPRQTDLNLEALASRFHEKQIEMESAAFKMRFLEQERILEEQRKHRQSLLDRSQYLKDQQAEMVAKIQAAIVQIPKPPSSLTANAIQKRKEQRRKREAQNVMDAIAQFEGKLKLDDDGSGIFDTTLLITKDDEDRIEIKPVDLTRPSANDDYIGRIRKRLNEDASARDEREKRRRRVLVDQMKGQKHQEDVLREEIMVNRLMRQSQQERRIAVQLLHVRHEKEVIRHNRIFRERQYEDRRLQDFEDTLDMEAEMAKLAQQLYDDQTRKDQALHDQIAAERAEARYKKHYDSCATIVDLVIEFACKVTEYRELTNGSIPDKLMREWQTLFVAGKPLFEPQPEPEEPAPALLLEEQRQHLLDEGDFSEYRGMVGEWQPLEWTDIQGPAPDNAVLGHVIQRLFNLVYPPTPPPPRPEFPRFPVRACVLGKIFSGKTTCVTWLAQEHQLKVLIVDELMHQAIEAHKDGELRVFPSEIENLESTENVTKGDTVGSHILVTSVASIDNPMKELLQEPTSPNDDAINAPVSSTDMKVDLLSNVKNVAAPSNAINVAVQSNETIGSFKNESSQPLDASMTSMKSSSKPILVGSLKSTSKLNASVSSEKPEPSIRAKLGSQALECLVEGKVVDDQLVVDILVEAIRRIPEDTGWVIDGFPQTHNQAVILEKALSGFDSPSTSSEPTTVSPKSTLVPDPRPLPPVPDPASGIDVIIQFEIEDDICMKRSAGRYYAVKDDEQYHQEFKPVPEGSYTGVGNQEKVIPIQDASYDKEQIQHRITHFHDTWPKMEEWFARMGTLKKIDANQPQEAIMSEVGTILKDTVQMIIERDKESTMPAVETETEPEQTTLETTTATVPETETISSKEELLKEESKSRPSSKGSNPASGKKSGSRGSSKEKSKREKSSSPKRSPSPKKSEKAESKKTSRGSTPKSPKRGRSGKKKDKTPEPEPEPEPEVPAGPPPPLPGSEEWEFVDQDLEMDLAEVLAKHWEAVERSYIGSNKHVFHNIRDEREKIYRYFYQIRQDYTAYLRRPDHKQEFVQQWQEHYNDVAEDVRDDEETRAELHQSVDDQRERLWNICDERKQQAETERETIINDGWLEDRLGLLSNHYMTIMQSEVDRFQDTVRMLKDYYRGMDGQIPDELNTTYARIPLIELPMERPIVEIVIEPEVEVEAPPLAQPPEAEQRVKSPKERSKSPRVKSAGDHSKSPKGSRSMSPKESRSKSPKDRSKSRTPSGKKRNKSLEKVLVEKVQEKLAPPPEGKRIPLVPRRPLSPDPDGKMGGQSKDKRDRKGTKKGDDLGLESPVPPTDLDEKLIFDGAQNGIIAVAQMMAQELALRELEEEAERQKELEKEREKDKGKTSGGKKGKKGSKSRSPSPKKRKEPPSESQPSPPLQTVELSEEDKQKKAMKDKMKQEYYFAIGQEDAACRARLELVRALGISILQDLKGKGDDAYRDMHDWLGGRYLKEMESIDHMSEVARYHIDTGEKIKTELMIAQDQFILDVDNVVMRTPSPPLKPAPVEQPMSDQFTVDQLLMLFRQFLATAPCGGMSCKAFCDSLDILVAVTHGMEELPDAWMNILPAQIREIGNSLISHNEYIDWRRFLLPLISPIATPTQTDLLETLARFQELDLDNTGTVSRELFEEVNLWFEEDETEIEGYDRLANLKKALFEIFSFAEASPPVLDYTNMLMYFSAMPNSHEGFLRALSVATGSHMPRPEKPNSVMSDRNKSVEETLVIATPELLDKVGDPPMSLEDIPVEAFDSRVPIHALFRTLHHPFNISADPEDTSSMVRLSAVYRELDESEDALPYRILIEHPLIQDSVTACQNYKLLDVKGILVGQNQDETHSPIQSSFRALKIPKNSGST